MLKIRKGLLEKIQELADEMHPIETCGIIAAPMGFPVAERLITMRNVVSSERYFQFDAKEQLKVWRQLEQRDEECRVIYHSHTDSIPYPSAEDIRFAIDPEIHYIIVATQPSTDADIRSFRIIDGRVTEESIIVIG
ncbi:M67 family metallopeptidase [Salmonella enterica]|nr:M67 family peptidase [Salmonella enterica]EBK1958061.1 M67 family metallopeptidase [Salmonella enterica subsp. enterica serovar Newport]ECI4612301.1 peptidase [Salmonella enterica subsp. diarizonae]EAT1016391.1 M67 family peptidase [Salmonella enterica]EBP1500252.1 M67 family metallopeptidase [Salmonella enterica]